VVFDIIYRYLKFRGYEVVYVRNYTDVDDKIINRANQEGIPPEELAGKYIQSYDQDMSALGIEKPEFTPKVSEHIPDIIETIKKIIEQGYAYVSAGDVFFSVRKFPNYGQLSKRSLDEMLAGARVEVNQAKQDPLDFALWKSAKPGEPKWQSPWGEGRPGWHIECSLMSYKYLGAPFDIHGGGKDLIFPHHENEIAQSETAFGKKMVNYWLHNGFVQINQEKMSKSLGNILLIKDLLKRYPSEVVRYFYASAHWRSPIDFSEEHLREAEEVMERFYLSFYQIEKLAKNRKEEPIKDKELWQELNQLESNFINAMDDDFNTAMLLGIFNDFLRLLNQHLDNPSFIKKPGAVGLLQKCYQELARLGKVIGVFQEPPEQYIERGKHQGLSIIGLSQKELEQRIEERAKARAEKNFKKADEIRSELAQMGILLEDTREGTEWRIDRSKTRPETHNQGGEK